MIKRIFFISLFLLSNLAACTLQSTYWVEDSVVTSKTIDSSCEKEFPILRIPEEKISFRIDANVIAKSFELNGAMLELGNVRFVTFMKKSPVDFSHFKEQLSELLRERYETIHIEEISVTPRGFIAALPANAEAVFDDRTPLNSKGVFYTLDSEGLRRYLDYSVEATLTVLHTSQPVSRKEDMSGGNTSLKTVKFTSFRDFPMCRLPEKSYRYRSNLKEGQLLTVRNIEEKPLVLKNGKVVATIHDGTVLIEFIATAMQEGLLYDIITIQKSDGTRVKGKVIGENRVELQ